MGKFSENFPLGPVWRLGLTVGSPGFETLASLAPQPAELGGTGPERRTRPPARLPRRCREPGWHSLPPPYLVSRRSLRSLLNRRDSADRTRAPYPATRPAPSSLPRTRVAQTPAAVPGFETLASLAPQPAEARGPEPERRTRPPAHAPSSLPRTRVAQSPAPYVVSRRSLRSFLNRRRSRPDPTPNPATHPAPSSLPEARVAQTPAAVRGFETLASLAPQPAGDRSSDRRRQPAGPPRRCREPGWHSLAAPYLVSRRSLRSLLNQRAQPPPPPSTTSRHPGAPD